MLEQDTVLINGGRGGRKGEKRRRIDKTGQAVYGRITSAILNSTFILIHCRRFFIILRKATAWRFFESVNSIYKHIIIIIIIITRCGL